MVGARGEAGGCSARDGAAVWEGQDGRTRGQIS